MHGRPCLRWLPTPDLVSCVLELCKCQLWMHKQGDPYICCEPPALKSPNPFTSREDWAAVPAIQPVDYRCSRGWDWHSVACYQMLRQGCSAASPGLPFQSV